MSGIKRVSHQLFEYSIYLFILTYPFSIRINSVVAVLMVLLGLLSTNFAVKLTRLTEKKGLLVLISYFTLMTFGLIYSEDWQTGLTVLEKSASFLFFPLFLATADPLDSKALGRISVLLIGVTVVASFVCFAGNLIFLTRNNIELLHLFYWEHAYHNLTDYIGFHPTYFSILILVVMVLIVFNISWTGIGIRLLLSGLLIFLTGFLLLLGAKIAIVLLLVLATVTGIVMLRKNKIWLLCLAIGNAALITIAYILPVTYWRFKSAYDSVLSAIQGKDVSDYRIMHWRCSWQSIMEHPIFGVGTGDLQVPLDNCYRQINAIELLGFNSHNQFMDGWLALGLPGLLITLLCFLIPLRDAIQQKNRSMVLIIVIYFVTALTESIFWTQKGIVLFCFLLCVFYGHGWPHQEKVTKI